MRMNKGISLARGRFIGTLNADDCYLPEALSQVAEKTKAIFGGIIYGDYIFTGVDAGVEFPVRTTLQLTHGMTLGHPSSFVSAATYQNIGLYDLIVALCRRFGIFSARAAERDCLQSHQSKPARPFRQRRNSRTASHPAPAWKQRRVIRGHVGLIQSLPFVGRSLQRIVSRRLLSFTKVFGQSAYLALKTPLLPARVPGAKTLDGSHSF